MNPGGGSGWDEPPLDIQVPDDARELERDVLAYRRELRAQRRRKRLRRLAGPFARGSAMPLLASILAVCLVAGAMLSVATFSPATSPAEHAPRPTAAASSVRPPTTPPSSSAASATHRARHSISPSASSLSTTGPATGRTRPAVHASATGSAGAPR